MVRKALGRSDIALVSRGRENALKGLSSASIAIDKINRLSNLTATMFPSNTLDTLGALIRSIQLPPPGLERLQEFSKAMNGRMELLSSSALLNAKGLIALMDASNYGLARIDEMNLMAKQMLAGLNMEQYGSALNLSANLSRNLWLTHDNLATSAIAATSSLFQGKFSSELQMAHIRYLPSMELLSANSLVRSISIESPDIDETESAEYAATIVSTDSEVSLETLLYRLDYALSSMWNGAKQSLSSGNPERIAHTTLSLRRLFDQILNSLAPIDDVRNWSNSPDHFKGRVPTRRAKLLFICKYINNESFSDFIEKDIDTILCAFKLFNRGAHEKMADYSDMQLKALMARFESTVRWLIEIRSIS